MGMWMAHFGHPTSKRTLLVSNSREIAGLQMGKLHKSQKPADAPKTAVKYIDGKGVERYKGTDQLKCTQSLGIALVFF